MQLIDRVMALGAAIRYAALAHGADITIRQRPDLREGDGVEFEVGQGPKGPRAENVKRTTT